MDFIYYIVIYKTQMKDRIKTFTYKMPLKTQVFFSMCNGNLSGFKQTLNVVEKFADAIEKGKIK